MRKSTPFSLYLFNRRHHERQRFILLDVVTPKSSKVRKTDSRAQEKKAFNFGAAFPGANQFSFGSPLRPMQTQGSIL
jgi:hypothetical protein